MKITVDGRTFDVSLAGGEVSVDGEVYRVRTEGRGPLKTVYVNEQPFRVETPAEAGGEFLVNVDAKYRDVKLEAGGTVRRAPRAETQTAPKPTAVKGGVLAAMAGRILRVAVAEDTPVKSGELLLVFEAMKMENEIRSTQEGVVKQVAVKAGDRVSAGDLLLVIE